MNDKTKPMMTIEELMETLKIRLRDSKENSKKKKNKVAQKHTITIDDLFEVYARQNGVCAETGIVLTKVGKHKGKYITENRWTTLSIDRLDCEKGYIPGNIRLTGWAVNTSRGRLSVEEAHKQMVEFVEQLGRTYLN